MSVVVVSAPVSVVIVNFRTPDLTAAAVASVLKDPSVGEVHVVDNASGDDSVQRLLEAYRNEPRVRVIASATNGGFGAGVNLGATNATGQALFVLNSDAVIVDDAISQLWSLLEAARGVSLIAPRLETPSGKLQRDVFGRFPDWRIFRRFPESGSVDWISGAAFMIRSQDFKAVGGFDERYWMYWEDVDLCWRLAKLGKRVALLDSARVIHQGGRSSSEKVRWAQARRARRLFLREAGFSFLFRSVMVARGLVGALRAKLTGKKQDP